MQQEGLVPNVTTHNALIQCLRERGLPQRAMVLFVARLQESCYNALSSACVQWSCNSVL